MKSYVKIDLSKVVRWLLISFVTNSVSLPVKHYDTLIGKLTLVKESVGVVQFLKIVKSIRSNYINYLSGNPERDLLTKCTKDGIPVILGELIPIVRGGGSFNKYLILTLLYSTRSLKLRPEPNTLSVTQP